MSNTPRHQPAPTWFDAQFEVGNSVFTVGPFDSSAAAEEFGQHERPGATYLGFAERVGHKELDRRIAAYRLHNSFPADRRTGMITRWRDTSGFITDSNGVSWFASRDDLPDGHNELPVNTRVTFAGTPKPRPGKKYPQAHSITLA